MKQGNKKGHWLVEDHSIGAWERRSEWRGFLEHTVYSLLNGRSYHPIMNCMRNEHLSLPPFVLYFIFGSMKATINIHAPCFVLLWQPV